MPAPATPINTQRLYISEEDASTHTYLINRINEIVDASSNKNLPMTVIISKRRSLVSILRRIISCGFRN